jgi:hypothetical protein
MTSHASGSFHNALLFTVAIWNHFGNKSTRVIDEIYCRANSSIEAAYCQHIPVYVFSQKPHYDGSRVQQWYTEKTNKSEEMQSPTQLWYVAKVGSQ